MNLLLIGSFKRNFPYGTEIAFSKGLLEYDITVDTFDPYCGDDFVLKNYDAIIVFKTAAKFNGLLKDCSDVIILYQPDDIRILDVFNDIKHMKQFCDYALIFDGSTIQAYEDVGYKLCEELIVTANNDLYRHLNLEKNIDFCFVGSLSNAKLHFSRREMISVLSKYFNVFYSTSFDIDKIVKTYNSSKVVLNHATDVGQFFGYGYGYQCRIFEAGMTKSCVLTNSIIDDKKLFNDDELCYFDSEQSLIENASILLENYNNYAEKLYYKIQKFHMPINRAQQIVNFINKIKLTNFGYNYNSEKQKKEKFISTSQFSKNNKTMGL